MPMNPRTLRPSSTFTPKSISGLALWLDGSDSSSLYTTDAGPVEAVSSPLDISGCVGWWDASDASTLFDADTGTTLATTTVGRWANKGSLDSAADLQQSNSTKRPAIAAGFINGLPAVEFDGVDDALLRSFTLDATCHIFCVLKWPVSYVTNLRSFDGHSQNTLSISRTSNTTWSGIGSATKTLTPATFNSLIGQIVEIRKNGTSSRITSNGVGQVTGDLDTTAPNGLTLGAFGLGTTAFDNVGFGEVVVFSDPLSVADAAKVSAYLAAKWGISGVHAPATATSDPVGYWRDKSGSGLAAATADATKRPVITSINGRNAVDFDGSNDNLIIQGYAAENGLTGLTRYAVARLDVNVSAIMTTTSDNGISNAGGARFVSSQSSEIQFAAGNAGFTVTSANVANSTYTLLRDSQRLLGVTYDGSKATVAEAILAHYNGATLPPTSTTGSVISPLVSGGTRLHLGSNVNANNWWNGAICEYLVYNRTLSTSERRRVESYLARRWGIALAPQVSNADAQDWVNRVYANGGTVSTSTASAVNTLCDSLDAASLRDRFYRLNLFCGTGLNAALVPLYRGPTPRTGKNVILANSSAIQISGNGWLALGTATKGAAVIAPDGTTTATSVTLAAAGDVVRHTPQFAGGAVGTFSAWVRKPSSGGADFIRLTTNNTVAWNTGVSQKFTLTTVWQRVSVSGVLGTGSGTGVHVHLGATDAAGSGDSDCVGVVELWNPQVEVGSLSGYEGPQYGNGIDTNNAFVGVGTDYAETGAGGGLTGNGTSKYLNTGLTVSNIGTADSGHMSVYHGESTGTNVNRYYMGANDSSTSNRFYFGTDAFSTASVFGSYGAVANASESLAAQGHGTAGHRILSRETASLLTHYHNGSSVATNTTTITPAVSTAAFAVFAANRNGTVDRWHNSWIAAYSIGLGLSATQAGDYRTIMQAFQTALGRNV